MLEYEVIIATYNGAQYIEPLLASIAIQTIKPRTIIISDDGSNDGTLDIVRAWGARHDLPLKITSNLGTHGPAHNFFNGLAHSKAPWVFFADQDDVWTSDRIDLFSPLLIITEKPLLVFSDAQLVDQELRPLHHSHVELEALAVNRLRSKTRLLYRNTVQGACMAINRALISVTKPSTAMIMHDWWITLWAATLGTIRYIPQSTLLYRIHGQNHTGVRRLNQPVGRIRSYINTLRNFTHVWDVVHQARQFVRIYNKESFTGHSLGAHASLLGGPIVRLYYILSVLPWRGRLGATLALWLGIISFPHKRYK